LMEECNKRPELTAVILQNIRSGMYDEVGGVETSSQVPWPRSYTKAKQLPDKFLRMLLPKMEPDRLSAVVARMHADVSFSVKNIC
jgi:hypothetical protein